MSYCRWSSMNWMCDVYVYEGGDGGVWFIHVAKQRMILPPIPEASFSRPSLYLIGRAEGTYSAATKTIAYTNLGWACLYKAWSWLARRWDKYLHEPTMRLIPHRDIGGQFDGDTLMATSAVECASLLQDLRSKGYNVPQYAIDELLSEASYDPPA